MVDKKLQTIIKKAVKGDKKAFVSLCEISARDVLYLCELNMRNHEDAEDAAQEVFIRMQKYIPRLKKPEAFSGWLSRLTTNTCNSLRRKEMNHNTYIPIEDVEDDLCSDTLEYLPQQYVENADLQEQIVDMVKRLPNEYRQYVLLHYFQQLSYREISEALEVTQDKVDYSLRMARKHMKVEIDELRQKDAKLWQQTPMFSFGSAMQIIFANSAKSTISPEAISACLQGAGVYNTAAPTPAAGEIFGAKPFLQTAAIITATLISICAAVYTVQRIVLSTPTTSYSATSELHSLPQGQESSTANWDDEDKPALIAMVSGRVYINNSNVVDPLALMGLADVKVELIHIVNNTVVATTETKGSDENGVFCFDGFEEGQYQIRVTLPQGLSPANSGSCEADGKQAVLLKNQGSTIFTLKRGEKENADISLALRNNATITGKVTVQAGKQELVSSLPAVTVHLLDPQGRTLAETAVGEDGQYRFINPAISQTATYTLLFRVGNVAGLQVPLDSLTFPARPGQSTTLPTRQLTDTYPPQVEILLTGASCACGHENPTGAQIHVTDATPVSLQWQISGFSSTTAFASGTDETSLAASLSALEEGEYALTATAQDAAGNLSSVKQIISIIKHS